MANFLTALELFLYLSIPLSSVPRSSEDQPLPHPDTTDVSQDLLIGDTALHIPGAEQEMISSSCLVIFACLKSVKER